MGDSKGGVVALKLSPNLRKSLLPPQAAAGSGIVASTAASSAGGGAGLGAPAAVGRAAAAAAGESKQASAASKLAMVELERQKLEAVIAVARRSQAPVLSEEAAARQ